MTEETDELKHFIDEAKEKLSEPVSPLSDASGYNTTIRIITDLLACIIVGLAIGIFLQNVFDTSILLTAILTLLGGVAGLWTVVRFGISQGRKQDEYLKSHPEPHKPIPHHFDDEDQS